MSTTKVYRPWSWQDIKTPTGWITPIGFISNETIEFFTRPYAGRVTVQCLRVESDSTLGQDALTLRGGTRVLLRIGDGPIARVDGGDPGDEHDGA